MRIVTTSPVNIRSGPAMVYETVGKAKRGMEFQSTEYKKDGGKTGWYKTSLGWICEKYVSVAKDYKSTVNFDYDPTRNASISLGGGTKAIDAINSVRQSIQNGSWAQSTLAQNVLTGVFGSSGYNTPGEDVYLAKRIFGEPYQFRDNVDIRNPSGRDAALGISYLEAMTESPTISVLPGNPLFLPDLSDQQKANYFNAFDNLIKNFDESSTNFGNRLNAAVAGAAQKTLAEDSNVDIRYFTFQPNYVEYIRYVNTLCWMFSSFLGLNGKNVPGFPADTTYGNFNWAQWHMSNAYAGRVPNVDQMEFGTMATYSDALQGIKDAATKAYSTIGAMINGTDDESYGELLATYSTENMYTDFFINPNVSYSETFSNSTKESMISNLISGASEMSKEIAFLLSSGASADANKSAESLYKMIQQLKNGLGGNSNSIASRVLGAAQTVISGANVVFPQMWAGSEYSRNYSVDISLKTPYGTREGIYKDIIVPMCHWIALAAPIQSTVNTYRAPFLCRFFIPGFCAVDMGIVESLSITKGGDGSAWSIDGLPLQVDLSISIKDLYSALSISRINACSPTDIYNMLWNTSLIDYVSVNSGLDMKQSEWRLKMNLAETLGVNSLKDIAVRPADEVRQTLGTSSLRGLFGAK